MTIPSSVTACSIRCNRHGDEFACRRHRKQCQCSNGYSPHDPVVLTYTWGSIKPPCSTNTWNDRRGPNSNAFELVRPYIVNEDGSAKQHGTPINPCRRRTTYTWFVGVQDSNGNVHRNRPLQPYRDRRGQRRYIESGPVQVRPFFFVRRGISRDKERPGCPVGW